MKEKTWGTPGVKALSLRETELLALFNGSTIGGQQQIFAFAQIVQHDNPEIRTAEIIPLPVRV